MEGRASDTIQQKYPCSSIRHSHCSHITCVVSVRQQYITCLSNELHVRVITLDGQKKKCQGHVTLETGHIFIHIALEGSCKWMCQIEQQERKASEAFPPADGEGRAVRGTAPGSSRNRLGQPETCQLIKHPTVHRPLGYRGGRGQGKRRANCRLTMGFLLNYI